jgi:surface carbohydrate biosynthesis protein (TIGR04326 family)
MKPTPLERLKITRRYVEAIHALGMANLDGETLRCKMMVDGIDFWAASIVRESSPWRPNFFERLSTLQAGEHAGDVKPPSILADWRIRAKTIWHCVASLAAGALNRGESLCGDVIFVGYLPATTQELTDADAIARYFGDLPQRIESIGYRVSVLFLPTDSPIARMSPAERLTDSGMHRTMCSPALTSFMSVRTVVRAIRTWIRLQRSLSRRFRLEIYKEQSADVATLMPLITKDLQESLLGTASLRAALLDAGFSAALASGDGPQLVIYPYEGQSWEVCLETVCQRLKIPSIAYLHTIVKPWDLRAHTGLRESAPRILALHGPHDRNELGQLASQGVSVEALRYGHLEEPKLNTSSDTDLRQASFAGRDAGDKRMLVILGSDCAKSTAQLNQLIDKLALSPRGWQIFVKPHPQCASTRLREGTYQTVDGNLSDALQSCHAVFLCGTAAPLDSYLSGIPTACLVEPCGYSMNPLEPDDLYFVGESISEILDWFEAAIIRDFSMPNVSRFFDLNSGLDKWRQLLSEILTANHEKD